MSPELAARVLEKVPEDEPIFIIRAQDAMALSVISTWIVGAIRQGVNLDKVLSAHHHWESIAIWQQEHPPKLPD